MKRQLCVCVLLLFCVFSLSHAAVIEETQNPKGWMIQTNLSTYQIAIANDGVVIPVYYGPTADYAAMNYVQVRVNPKVGSTIREVPYRGGFIEQIPAVEVVYPDHTRDVKLVYHDSTILEEEGQPTLRIDLKDPEYNLRLSSFIRVFPELDVLEKWLVLSNVGEESILIENAQSGSVILPKDEYDLFHLSGTWGREFMLQRTRLTPGVKTIQVRDFGMHNNPPWFAVVQTNNISETNGFVWFGNLAWSGNWRLDFEKKLAGEVQIIGGINFWDTQWTLGSSETFTTPKMIFGFANNGLGGASQRSHDYVRQHVLRDAFKDKLRPVLYNSWYATTFNVNEEQQLELARIAKEIGVELFVIDDGWFHGRNDDHAGLGDWWVDKKKFPNGLQPMIGKINDMGLDFGIWVEPEMVNPDSDLYRAHPDWVFHYPKRTRHEQRNQLMLNLAREDVCDYLLDSLSKLLSENNIRFIKWDRNRRLSEPGWPDIDPSKQREVRIRYVHNLYNLIAELEKRFPEVWFEVCSGGGGRNDLGIFSLMDQIWTSDNTDPLGRILIQYGFLHALPPNVMVSWITDEDWQRIGPSLDYRFHVAMSGVLGIGNDLTEWSENERQLATRMIEEYKEIRPIVQQGTAHRLISPFERTRAAIEYVASDQSEAVVFLYSMLDPLIGSTPTAQDEQVVRLRGLDPNAVYQLSGARQEKVDGKTLMNSGIPWFLQGSFKSALVKLKRLD